VGSYVGIRGRCQQSEDLKLGVLRRVWVDNAEMSFKEIG
jgi:hypothetical protein